MGSVRNTVTGAAGYTFAGLMGMGELFTASVSVTRCTCVDRLCRISLALPPEHSVTKCSVHSHHKHYW